MKKVSAFIFCVAIILFAPGNAKSQVLKIGVFDIELMVQAMPGYRAVDSLMGIYNRDSLGALREYYELEYNRLDSTYKADSVLAASGQKSKAVFDMVTADRQKAMLNIVYWQQIAQDRSDTKRAQLSEKLFKQVSDAYKKVLARKKYTLVLKPNTYEAGFRIDNIFIAVARELKLSELPQQLIFLGDDPDPVKQPATTKPPATKPKN